MKHGVNRWSLDPVLAPDQFGVAKPLGPEDVDRCVTRHGIYPAFPAPIGAPWSEYVRSQMKRSRSVSSSTEALDSDHARYITSRIVQHARSLTMGTRSLPIHSPVNYFQQVPQERGQISWGCTWWYVFTNRYTSYYTKCTNTCKMSKLRHSSLSTLQWYWIRPEGCRSR